MAKNLPPNLPPTIFAKKVAMSSDKNKYNFRFELGKEDKTGMRLIMLVVSHDEVRKRISTGQKIFPYYWAGGKPRFFSDTEILKKYGKVQLLTKIEINDIETVISTEKKRVSDIADVWLKSKEKHAIDDLIEAAKNAQRKASEVIIKPISKESVIDFIDRFCVDNDNRIDLTLKKSKRTIYSYKGVASDLREFEQTNKKYEAKFSNIDAAYLAAFAGWQIITKKNNNTTTSKKVSILKTLITFAGQKKYGYSIKNINPEYKEHFISRGDNENEVIALEYSEYVAICNLPLDGEMEKTRDVFVFSCNTGLRVSDLLDLKRSHIKGNKIEKLAVKTNTRLKVPLSGKALEILGKYSNSLTPLPKMTEQVMNRHLKQIGEIAGVNTPIEKIRRYGIESKAITQPKYERLSMHVGRKTFVSMCLAAGKTVTAIRAITGHKSLKAFQRYIDVTDAEKADTVSGTFDVLPDAKKESI